MFDTTATAWDAEEKISAFRPKYILGTVIPDQYDPGGGLIDTIVDITENSDGNILVTLPFTMGIGTAIYYVGDRIYLLSGAYKGYHKIYRVTSGTVECLSPWTANEIGIELHHVESNLLELSWLTLASAPIDSVLIEPVIKSADNSIRFDIAAYFIVGRRFVSHHALALGRCANYSWIYFHFNQFGRIGIA